jgi:hypothetical protein
MENQKTDSTTIVNKGLYDIHEIFLAKPLRIVLVYDGVEYEAYIYSAGVTMEFANLAASTAAHLLKGNHFYIDYDGTPVLFETAKDALSDVCATFTSLWFGETHERYGDYKRMYTNHFSPNTDYWPYLHLQFSYVNGDLSDIV